MLALGVIGAAAPATARAEDAGAAAAARRALQSACFAPQDLAAKAGEQIAVKGTHEFAKPPARTAVAEATAVDAALRGSIRRVELPKGQKLIALTFDLCEDRGEIAGYEGRIIDYLRHENVKATLFAGGKWMRSHLARTKQLMTDPLFELANHAEAHRNLRLLNGINLTDEILGPQRAYEAIRSEVTATQCSAAAPDGLAAVPQRMSLFRFPFGACKPQAMAAVNDAGLLAVQWDLSTGDPDPRQSAQAIARAMIKSVKPGSIIIAHANGRGWNTADALPLAIPKLKAAGFEFVTVSELLAAGKPVIAETCYDNKPGDTDRYDTLHALLGRPKAPAGQTASFELPWATETVKAKPRKKDEVVRDPFFQN